jgi:hypothetical protein
VSLCSLGMNIRSPEWASMAHESSSMAPRLASISSVSLHCSEVSVLSSSGSWVRVHGPRLGCAVIFASKQNEAKRKQIFFLFDAIKRPFRLFSHRSET